MKPDANFELAQRIVKHLFVNGAGQQAERIELIDATGKGLGGWGPLPAVHAIMRLLDEARPQPQD